MPRIPVTHSEPPLLERPTPWHWLVQGWHSLRDRTLDSLIYFSPHSADAAEPSRVARDNGNNSEQRWGVVAINLIDGPLSVDADLEIPGMEKSNLSIDVIEGYLVVSGEKYSSSLLQQKDVLVTERAFGRFERRVALPCSVDVEGATASYERGVLKVCLPKQTA